MHRAWLTLVAGWLPLAAAAVVENADFEAAAGSWGDGDGPPGWTLNLDDDGQRGVVAAIAAQGGQHAFRFTDLRAGFGANRLEQCVPLAGLDAVALAAWVHAPQPHAELSVRLRVDFYADADCDQAATDAGAVQIETDFRLEPSRFEQGDWTRLESAQRLTEDLPGDTTHARISLRARDRSAGGDPDPAGLEVWFDTVSVQPTVGVLPAPQRAALRALYEDLGGSGWQRRAGWMGPAGSECRWEGVQCAPDGRSVVGLDLAANGLTGELPGELAALEDLSAGRLDLCWNSVEAGPSAAAFANARQLGGDLAACQQPALIRFDRNRSGHIYQSGERSGEGFMLHMVSARSALLFWLTYDDAGYPLWLFGSGTVRDRVLRIDHLYHAQSVADGVVSTPVGRATLVFTGCDVARLRFHVEGSGFGANGRRNLRYIDGRDGCDTLPGANHPMAELSGHWYDPAQSGEGLSLAPVDDSRFYLNWMGHDADGQYWLFAVGRLETGGMAFDPVYRISGGRFEGSMQNDPLWIEVAGDAWLEYDGNVPVFSYRDMAGIAREFRLRAIGAGPALLANSGYTLNLDMAPSDLALLYERDPYSDERLPGAAAYPGFEFSDSAVGLRFRGRSSRVLPKLSFNVQHEREQPLLFWSDRMNLNATYTDPTLMREALGFELFREVGQPASRTRHLDLWLNGRYEGLYVHVERVDEGLLTANGLNPDGTLVRDQFRGLIHSDPLVDRHSAFGFDLSVIPAEQRADFLAQRFDSRNDPDWERLVELVEWVYDTPPGAQYQQGLEARFNVDNLADWLALHWLIGDIDSNTDDYWLYLDHEDPEGRWHIIPWDKDLSFGSHYRDGFFTDNDFFAYEYPLHAGSNNELLRRFLLTPAFRQRMDQRITELMAQFPESWFRARTAELAEQLEDSLSIKPGGNAFVQHVGNHHSHPEHFELHVEALRDFIALRYRFIQRQLAGGDGPWYQAAATVTVGDTGAVYLTDDSGFTMAALAPVESWPRDVTISLSVEENTALTGIDREWHLHADDELGTVRVTLFYRNDLDSHFSRGNWWTGGDEPVGRQQELVMQAVAGETVQTLETRINPYSNKAEAELGQAAGDLTLRLVLP